MLKNQESWIGRLDYERATKKTAKQDERWRFSDMMAYEILDIRGNSTAKVEVKLKGGASGRATR